LLLDEPTNHLDIPAQEVLQSVLEGFSGTMLIVSHDRYLISRLATHIWSISDGQLTVFDGTYGAYVGRDGRARPDKSEPSPLDMPAPDPNAMDWIQDLEAPPEMVAFGPAASGRQAKKAWATRLGELESQLDEAELRVETLGALLDEARASEDDDEAARLEQALISAETELSDLSDAWDQLLAE
jgi:ATP-binding cassette subfamily F protein 3